MSKHRNIFLKPPQSTPVDHSIDGPLMGNGDVGVAISGPAETMQYWIAKNDFWKLREGRRFDGGPAPIGGLTLHCRDLFRVGTYRIEQDLYSAETIGTFQSEDRHILIKSWVAATENILIVEIENKGASSLFEAELWITSGRGSECELRADDKAAWGFRKFHRHCLIATGAGIAAMAVDCPLDGTFHRVSLDTGQRAVMVISLVSSFDDPDYADEAVQRVVSMAEAGAPGIEDLREKHLAWWEGFWNESLVQIDDPVIEAQYYRSQYILASTSRNPDFPPSIFGTWVTTDNPMWMGDYHLNYNHMAPYYGLYSSNHIKQAAPYEAPILDFSDRGRYYASRLLGIRGIYLPVGIGPKGIETTRDDAPVDRLAPHYEEGGLFFGQKSNAAYAVVNIAMRWFATYDEDYGELVYPLVLAVGEFWEDYLKWDGSRYVIESDSIHEGSGPDFNPILSLGLVRCVFDVLIDMSSTLGVDGDRRESWQKILDHMSEFPIQQRGGRTVFRYSERGVDWYDSNTLGIQHIYPAGVIGPASSPELLQVGRDTITVMDRWFDTNGMNSLYPAAVRVGYDPETILKKLREHCDRNLHPNGFTVGNPHGIETCSTVPNAINEMLLTSHNGVLRIFHNWPENRYARFANLRARGAFLVSAELKGGAVTMAGIHSEKGRSCLIQNPWPDCAVRIIRSGGSEEVMDGDILELPTTVGETISIMS